MSAADEKKRPRRMLVSALLALLLGVAGVAIFQIVSIQSNYARANSEYDSLREMMSDAADVSSAQAEGFERAPDLADVNADYIGWIRIDGTVVDYPVVRGADNTKYLTTTFKGEQNPSGAIFMDARCAQGFDGALAIIYGHNMNDGSMFAQLKRYPEGGAPAEQEIITILTPRQGPLVYRIFAVLTTNSSNEVYTLPGAGQQPLSDYMTALGAPQGARQFLVLSTCTSRGDDTERRLVFATRDL